MYRLLVLYLLLIARDNGRLDHQILNFKVRVCVALLKIPLHERLGEISHDILQEFLILHLLCLNVAVQVLVKLFVALAPPHINFLDLRGIIVKRNSMVHFSLPVTSQTISPDQLRSVIIARTEHKINQCPCPIALANEIKCHSEQTQVFILLLLHITLRLVRVEQGAWKNKKYFTLRIIVT